MERVYEWWVNIKEYRIKELLYIIVGSISKNVEYNFLEEDTMQYIKKCVCFGDLKKSFFVFKKKGKTHKLNSKNIKSGIKKSVFSKCSYL